MKEDKKDGCMWRTQAYVEMYGPMLLISKSVLMLDDRIEPRQWCRSNGEPYVWCEWTNMVRVCLFFIAQCVQPRS